jgi:hypothetical protein
MKFEHLLWVVILLFYLVSVILKKKFAASKTGGNALPQKPSAWKEKLNSFLLQVQQSAGQKDTLENPEPNREVLSSEKIKAVAKKPPLPKIKPAVAKTAAKRPQTADLEKTLRPEASAFGIKDLRKAVIWSEILAPPLALREK